MVRQNTISLFLTVILTLFMGCGNNGRNPQNDDHKSNLNAHVIDGIYYYNDNRIDLQITITGDKWTGRSVIISEYGSKSVEYFQDTLVQRSEKLREPFIA